MPDEKEKKSRVVVRGEGSCHVEGSGARVWCAGDGLLLLDD